MQKTCDYNHTNSNIQWSRQINKNRWPLQIISKQNDKQPYKKRVITTTPIEIYYNDHVKLTKTGDHTKLFQNKRT